jgi:hypothetical protein
MVQDTFMGVLTMRLHTIAHHATRRMCHARSMRGRRCSRQTELLCAAKHELFELEASGFDLDRPLPDYKPRMEKVSVYPVGGTAVAQLWPRAMRAAVNSLSGPTQCGRSTVRSVGSGHRLAVLRRIASHRIASHTARARKRRLGADVV